MRIRPRWMAARAGLVVAGIAGSVALASAAFGATTVAGSASAGAHRMPTIVISGSAPGPSAHSAMGAGDATEPHPEIRAAINSLERAKDHLQHAAHDFGGHRVEAIAAIDAALRQLRQALAYDR